ncbi:MAG: hypothetical protein RLZ10_864 [Bacteroidota bacterium]|jgi:hypothetical protein
MEEKTTGNTGLAKVAVQCLNEHWCFLSISVVVNNFHFRNREILIAAIGYVPY